MRESLVIILAALVFDATIFTTHCFALKGKQEKADLSFEIRDSIDYSVNPIVKEDMVLFVEKGRLTFWRWNKKPIYFSEKVSSPAMAVEGDKVAVSWVEKRDGKAKIGLILSQDRGENWAKVNESAPFDSVQLVKIAWFKGKVHILAEDISKKSIAVGVLENGSDVRWYPLDLTDTGSIASPSLAVTVKGVFIFLGEKEKNRSAIACYLFDPGRDGVYEKFLVKEGVDVVSFVETDNQRELPEALVKYSRNQEIVLSLFYLDKEGFREVPLVTNEDVAFAHKVYPKDDSVLVVYSSEIPGKTKQRVFVYKANLPEKMGTTARLDNGFDNTFAWLPVAVHDGRNRVFVVWEDSRLIRRGVFATFSPDNGKTWQRRNILLSFRKNYSFRPTLSFYKDAFYVSWLQFSNDTFSDGQLVFAKILSPEKLFTKKNNILDPEKTERLLVKRVNDYWKYMISRDFRKTYSFYDPFFRARIKYENYAAKLGSIIYHKAQVEGVEIKGPEATVHIKVLYEVKDLIVGNQKFSSEKEERLLHDLWIFVDNEWHKKYINPLMEGSSIRY
ncbi:MAG: hypothetical protein WHS38_11820 [Thermodesulforhabdaceae bacterium]